jgi:hypothetical protein
VAPLAVTGGDVMFILGLLVLAASAVAAVELILANRGPMDFHMWSWSWQFDTYWLAVIGAIIVTAAWIGMGLMKIAFGHARRIRREHRALAEENRLLAERAGAVETMEPMPPERATAGDRPVGEGPVPTADALPADGTYEGSQPGQHAAEGGFIERTDEDDDDHQGFFSRHAISGRGHRR